MSYQCVECRGTYTGAAIHSTSNGPSCEQCFDAMCQAVGNAYAKALAGSMVGSGNCGSGLAAGSRRTCPPNCVQVNVPMDLCEASLSEAANMLAASRFYELIISPLHYAFAKQLLIHVGAQTKDHPFAPYINLYCDSNYLPDEWSLQLNGQGVWSPGV